MGGTSGALPTHMTSGSNLFNMTRPSFDRSAILAMNRSEKISKRMQATNPQSKKKVSTSSSEASLSSESSMDDDLEGFTPS